MLKCEKCGNEYKNERSFSGHKAHCGKQKKRCPICGRLVSSSGYGAHVKTHERDTICPVCKKPVFGGGCKRFCSSSCAATYNNKGVRRHGKAPQPCLFCGKPQKKGASKFCSSACQHKFDKAERVKKVLATGNALSGWSSVRPIKNFLLEHLGEFCSICGRTEWEGQKIPLVMDHVDGNAENWSLINLRLVCGNCDMLLSTYKGKNKGKGRLSRKERYRQGKSY